MPCSSQGISFPSPTETRKTMIQLKGRQKGFNLHGSKDIDPLGPSKKPCKLNTADNPHPFCDCSGSPLEKKIDEMHRAILKWLHIFNIGICNAGSDGLVYRWNKCHYKYGDYEEKFSFPAPRRNRSSLSSRLQFHFLEDRPALSGSRTERDANKWSYKQPSLMKSSRSIHPKNLGFFGHMQLMKVLRGYMEWKVHYLRLSKGRFI
ncbi:hypothetical protein TNCV_798981 [Trichonephila clavipes]|nr:hypothetical protein TNCV_798981 [Trichonephila clavipes]